MFYNILHFITYYLTLTQLGFIFSVKQSCIKKFKGFRCFGASFKQGAQEKVPFSRRPLEDAINLKCAVYDKSKVVATLQ
jgi:hypothetical protein